MKGLVPVILFLLCAAPALAIYQSCSQAGPAVNGYVTMSCVAWGAVEYGNPSSYNDLQNPLTLQQCPQKWRDKCGCLGQGSVILRIPETASQGTGIITRMVSGSGTLIVKKDGNTVGTVTGAATPLAPTSRSDYPLQPGENVFAYNNNQAKNTQSCFELSYTYVVPTDEDFDQNLCERGGFDWWGGAEFGARCCGDDQQAPPQGDFLRRSAGGICVKGTQWFWLYNHNDVGGRIVRFNFNPEGHVPINNGEAVYVNTGGVICSKDEQVLNKVGMPPQLTTGEFTIFKDALDPYAEKTTETHGYLCRESSTRAWTIAECAGGATALSQPVENPERLFATGAWLDGPAEGVKSTYWCRSDGRWSTNLDGDKAGCIAAGATRPKNETPVKWTGARCCGEEGIEFFGDPTLHVDPDKKGVLTPPFKGSGCWAGVIVKGDGKTDRFVAEEVEDDPNFAKYGGRLNDKSIINQNGTFHGCALPEDDPLLYGDYGRGPIE